MTFDKVYDYLIQSGYVEDPLWRSEAYAFSMDVMMRHPEKRAINLVRVDYKDEKNPNLNNAILYDENETNSYVPQSISGIKAYILGLKSTTFKTSI